MSTGLTLQVDVQGVEDLRARVRSLPRAEAAAVNRVALSSRTFASRTIRELYNIQATPVRDAITVSNKASAAANKFSAKLTASGRRIPLILFGGRHSSRQPGASVEVIRGRRLTAVGTFIARPTYGRNTGKAGIYVRVNYLKGGKRYPIRQLYGPSIPLMFGGLRMKPRLEAFVAERFPIEIDRAMDMVRSRALNKAAKELFD